MNITPVASMPFGRYTVTELEAGQAALSNHFPHNLKVYTNPRLQVVVPPSRSISDLVEQRHHWLPQLELAYDVQTYGKAPIGKAYKPIGESQTVVQKPASTIDQTAIPVSYKPVASNLLMPDAKGAIEITT